MKSVLSVASSLLMASAAMGAPTIKCNEGISTFDGKAITIVSAGVEGNFAVAASNACDCVTACTNEPGCAYSIFTAWAGCSLALVGGQCSAPPDVGRFFTTPFGAPITIANGPCGKLSYGGDQVY